MGPIDGRRTRLQAFFGQGSAPWGDCAVDRAGKIRRGTWVRLLRRRLRLMRLRVLVSRSRAPLSRDCPTSSMRACPHQAAVEPLGSYICTVSVSCTWIFFTVQFSFTAEQRWK